MVKMSLELELSIFADQVPFLAERTFRKFPEIKGDEVPDAVADMWTALALLIARRNDRTERVVMSSSCPKNRHGRSIVRINLFGGGYTRDELSGHYDIAISGEALHKMRELQYVAGKPQWGYTDDTELMLTDRGRQALVDHINTLPKKSSKRGK